jgi:hypothetical protein
MKFEGKLEENLKEVGREFEGNLEESSKLLRMIAELYETQKALNTT